MENQLFKVIYEDELGYLGECIVCSSSDDETEIISHIQNNEEGLKITLKDVFELKNEKTGVLVSKILQTSKKRKVLDQIKNVKEFSIEKVSYDPNSVIEHLENEKQRPGYKEFENQIIGGVKVADIIQNAKNFVQAPPVSREEVRYRRSW
jgi:hypothetical protein